MDMKILRAAERKAMPGPAQWFTGSVKVEMLFGGEEEGPRASGALVSFEAGARTVWHTHPLGQYLVVVSGRGWTQCWGGPKKEILAGDVVRCNCGRKHWHGASADEPMSHIAVQESLDGSVVTWLEPVEEAQYLSPVEPDAPAGA